MLKVENTMKVPMECGVRGFRLPPSDSPSDSSRTYPILRIGAGPPFVGARPLLSLALSPSSSFKIDHRACHAPSGKLCLSRATYSNPFARCSALLNWIRVASQVIQQVLIVSIVRRRTAALCRGMQRRFTAIHLTAKLEIAGSIAVLRRGQAAESFDPGAS
jgi:hypothetical protein